MSYRVIDFDDYEPYYLDRPVSDVTLLGPGGPHHQSWAVRALVDTGADYMHLPTEAAVGVGISLHDAISIELGSAGGKIEVRQKVVTVEILGVPVQIPVNFAPNAMALIGRQALFEVLQTAGFGTQEWLQHRLGSAPRSASCVQVGDLLIVDQTNRIDNAERCSSWGVLPEQKVGQEFRPKTYAFDAVDLFLETDSVGSYPAVLCMHIRQDSIQGEVLATSAPTTLSAGFAGMARFLFRRPVTVTPGALYVFEPEKLKGGTIMCLHDDRADVTSTGKEFAILKNEQINKRIDGTKLVFQTGIAYSVPMTLAHCHDHGWQSLVWPDGKAFVNENECLQCVDDGLRIPGA